MADATLRDPPTINTCIHWIAKLGGFLGRKRDGEPGVKTIWLGLRRLHDIADTWMLASSPLSARQVVTYLVISNLSIGLQLHYFL